MPDGNYVLKYDGYPVVAVVRNGSAADRAGLRVGDEILSVNGRSILSDGALAGISAGDELDLTLLRESREINLHLRSN
jgi:S1-C subfamily serine protease